MLLLVWCVLCELDVVVLCCCYMGLVTWGLGFADVNVWEVLLVWVWVGREGDVMKCLVVV